MTLAITMEDGRTFATQKIGYLGADGSGGLERRYSEAAGQWEVATHNDQALLSGYVEISPQWIYATDPAGHRGRWLKFPDWRNVTIRASKIVSVTDTDVPV